MSYEGTYGPDETCDHGRYGRNCELCNGAVERFARQRRDRIDHPAEAARIQIEARPTVLYTASCPSPVCQWRRGPTEDRRRLEEELAAHVGLATEVAGEWASETELLGEAVRRGLLPAITVAEGRSAV